MSTTGRHRSAAHAKTPLTALSDALTSNVGTFGRRTAVIAASSGLVMTCGLPAQAAAPAVKAPAPSGVTAEQPSAVRVSAALKVGDGQVDFSRDGFTATSAPAKPAAARHAARTTTASATRSTAASATTATASTTSTTTTQSTSGTSAATTTDTDTPSVGDITAGSAASRILSIAQRYFGVPYRWGGTTPAGFDCSGYVQYVYAQIGVNLPRTAAAQGAFGRQVSAAEARPGDLVLFGAGASAHHVGIYVGNGKMYDAPRTGQTVGEHTIWSSSAWFVRVL